MKRSVGGMTLPLFLGTSILLFEPQGTFAGVVDPPPSKSSVPEKVWPANVVRALQERLMESKFDPGPIDGIYGPRTANAIRDFQSSQRLRRTGRISAQLLDALRIN